MIYGYIRISTKDQDTENQRFQLIKFAKEHNLEIKNWVEIENPIDKWLDIIQYGLSLKKEDEEFYILRPLTIRG